MKSILIVLVVVLCEISVLFVMVIFIWMLKEKFLILCFIVSVIIMVGVVIIKFG